MKKYTSFEVQKGTRCIWGNIYFSIVFSCLSSTKPCLRFLLIYFAREIKSFYQSSLRNEVDSDMILGAKEIGGKASVESPNWGGGSSGGPPAGVLGGRAPYEIFFGLQRPQDSLRINSIFINYGYEARQKS